MGYVGSKTRSQDKILGNSCLHPRGYICYPILIKLDQNISFKNLGQVLKICHVWSKTRSPGQIL